MKPIEAKLIYIYIYPFPAFGVREALFSVQVSANHLDSEEEVKIISSSNMDCCPYLICTQFLERG